jgi:hypothetical protein
LLFSHSYYPGQGDVQKDSLVANAALSRVDDSHNRPRFSAASAFEIIDPYNFDHSDHKLLFVYLFVPAFWEKDTEKVLPVYIQRMMCEPLLILKYIINY